MSENPYARFDSTDLILRDELAIDRTVLANERTMLAYARTALALIISGFTFLHFVETGLLRFIGIVSVPLGFAIGVFGGWRFLRIKWMIDGLRKGKHTS